MLTDNLKINKDKRLVGGLMCSCGAKSFVLGADYHRCSRGCIYSLEDLDNARKEYLIKYNDYKNKS